MLILVLVGGMVTGTDAGMSVPDWPTTFGENMFLYPIDRMVSGLLVSIPNHLANDLDKGVMTKAVQNSVSVDENVDLHMFKSSLRVTAMKVCTYKKK